MAGKMFKDLKETVSYKLTGQKYHNSLLGESLQDTMRKATAKTLEAPDTACNQQVVDMINEESAGGVKDTREIVNLLKGRLRMDNPQKQFLAVKLVEQVLTDCTAVLGTYQAEILEEVARVMAMPAKPETDAGKRARQAAKELLRKYGTEGTTAFRAVNNAGYRPQARAGVVQGTYNGLPPTYPGAPVSYAASAASVERQSVIDEVHQLIDKARSNTELLSDMLVNSAGASDEFEAELVKDLANGVQELREMFNAYLEQISSMEGADMEQLVVQALEAVDMLDGAIALQKDVALNQQQELQQQQQQQAKSAAASGSASAAVAAAPPVAAAQVDLIGLDDLADAMTSSVVIQQPSSGGASSGVVDPFAASNSHDPFAASLAVGAPNATAPTGLPAVPPQPPPSKPASAFANMFSQPGGSAAYASLAGVAPTPAVFPSPAGYPQPPYPGMPAAAGAAPPFYGQQPPQYGGAAPVQHYAATGQPGAFAQPQQQQQQYAPYGGSQQQYAAPQQQYASPQQQYVQPPPANPFNASPGAFPPVAAAASPAAVSNPFGALPAGPAPQTTTTAVDAEWDLFFADRTKAK